LSWNPALEKFRRTRGGFTEAMAFVAPEIALPRAESFRRASISGGVTGATSMSRLKSRFAR
jgi:hypothetical protein